MLTVIAPTTLTSTSLISPTYVSATAQTIIPTTKMLGIATTPTPTTTTLPTFATVLIILAACAVVIVSFVIVFVRLLVKIRMRNPSTAKKQAFISDEKPKCVAFYYFACSCICILQLYVLFTLPDCMLLLKLPHIVLQECGLVLTAYSAHCSNF